LVDQYRCRLELVNAGKVSPGDIAKLTSLGDKSHHDLLQERYFYQSMLLEFHKLCQNDFHSSKEMFIEKMQLI
jgi:hypothetical protein